MRRLVGVLLSRAWIIVLVTVVVAGLAFALAKRSPNTYQATSVVRITNPNADNVFQNPVVAVDPKRLVDTETGVIRSNGLRNAVEQSLGDRASGIGQVSVANPSGTDLLQISVTANSPELARDGANTFADRYVANRKEQGAASLDQQADELRRAATEIRTQIEQLDRQIADAEGGVADALRSQRAGLVAQQADFNNRASEFEVEATLRGGNVQIVDSAELPRNPISPKPMRDAALAAVLAFLLAVAVTLLLDRLDTRITDPEELESITGGVPLFGTVPIYAPNRKRGASKLPKGARTLVPLDSTDAEVYRTLRSNLRFSILAKSKKIIMVTSPTGSEGKSTVTSNLAVSLAENGQRVVVVSADLRRPVISSVFGVTETAKGLTSVLLGDESLTDCLVPYVLESGQRLYVLPAGPLPSNPAEILGSQGMADLLRGLANADVDFVLVDCPPVLPVSDPLAVAQFVDGVIMLSVFGQTRKPNLREACVRLDRVGAEIMGIILNGVPTSRAGSYPYHYSRSYGPDEPATKRSESRLTRPVNPRTAAKPRESNGEASEVNGNRVVARSATGERVENRA